MRCLGDVMYFYVFYRQLIVWSFQQEIFFSDIWLISSILTKFLPYNIKISYLGNL